MRRYLLVAFGGALGAMLRYFIGVMAAERFGQRFPVGTFSINVSACFMIGFLLEYLGRHAGLNSAWRYVFAIGFVGAYSTFATFEWEAFSDITQGAFRVAVIYIGASVAAGFLAVALGNFAARSLP